MADWIAAIAGVLTALAAIPAAAAFMLDRRNSQDARLTLLPVIGAAGYMYVDVRYRAEHPAEAIAARVEVIGAKEPQLVAETNSIMRHDPMTDISTANPDVERVSALSLRLLRDHSDPCLFSGVFAVGGAASATRLKVTVSTWPTAKRLIQRNRTISAHA